METLVEIDGEILPAEKAMISVFDRGFLFGDSVYETLRTYDRRPFLFERHLARLERSARALWMAIPGGTEAVRRAVLDVLQAAGHEESQLRLVVTRGARAGFVDLDPDTAEGGSRIVLCRPLVPLPTRLYEEGVDVALVGVQRTGRRSLDPKIKSGNYLNNLIALHEARRLGAFECLMPNRDGELTEGSTSNVFFVFGERLVTPSLEAGLLDGITRGFVLELARGLGFEVEEARLRPADVVRADEAFLTSSLKEVLPIRRLLDESGGEVWTRPPGSRTLRLLDAYREWTLSSNREAPPT